MTSKNEAISVEVMGREFPSTDDMCKHYNLQLSSFRQQYKGGREAFLPHLIKAAESVQRLREMRQQFGLGITSGRKQ